MDFQLANDVGYYFDRCIDLKFYDTDMNLVGILKTPPHGKKPTITIKGTFIEGGYAIDSYISIQNMAFDVDVAYVGYIEAKMYYSGLSEAKYSTYWNQRTKSGHTILYRVLYADQEKEPPNRCIRFQCVVASKDTSLFQIPLYISGGSVNYLPAGADANSLIEDVVNKSGSKVPLKRLCEELVKIYNEGVAKNTKIGTNKTLYNLVRISLLEIDKPLEDLTVELSSGEYKLGDFIRQLNSKVGETDVATYSSNKFKIIIDRGAMKVSTPVPDNWKEIARSKGTPESKLFEYYNENYASVTTNAYTVFEGSILKTNLSPVVPLNFVKSATRSENVIYVDTLFDDRITPGCHVAIKSNSIMGKKFGSSKGGAKGSRLIHYLDNDSPVVFRNTGKIEYLFSTTEESYMKMQGPVDDSKEALEWASKEGAMYE